MEKKTMAVSTAFGEKQVALAKIAKALGHPARIAILQVLMKQDSCVCNDIVLQLPLAQATVSQHLKVLKEAGLIQGEIAPNKSCYCIHPEGFRAAGELLGAFFGDSVVGKMAPCCD